MLDFDGEAGGDDGESSEGEEESDEEMSEDEGKKKGKGKEKAVKVAKTPVLTKEVLKGWQKSILEVSRRGSDLPLCRADPSHSTDPLPPRSSQATPRLPFCCFVWFRLR